MTTTATPEPQHPIRNLVRDEVCRALAEARAASVKAAKKRRAAKGDK